MVSLLIGGLLIGVVLQFVNGQTRFASVQTAREEVQQNARGALEVVAADLRGAISSGVLIANDQLVEFALPRRWGVVCRSFGGTTTDVAFLNSPGEVIPTGSGVGLMVQDPTTSVWLPAAVAPRATVTAVAPASLTAVPGCGNVRVSGDVVAFRLTGANHPAVTPGATVAVYEVVRYDVAPGRGGTWLRRSNGWGSAAPNMQPLAGPVDADSVGFRYFTGAPASAATLLAAPGAAAPAANIRMIRFRVRMTSRQALDGRTGQIEQDSATVQIRN